MDSGGINPDPVSSDLRGTPTGVKNPPPPPPPPMRYHDLSVPQTPRLLHIELPPLGDISDEEDGPEPTFPALDSVLRNPKEVPVYSRRRLANAHRKGQSRFSLPHDR